MRILFIFVDGVGLGDDHPNANPFISVDLPTLNAVTNGQPWLRGLGRIESERAVFIEADACLGVTGKPQSATGQAAILTGINVPRVIGHHYGPKPDVLVSAIVRQNNVIKQLTARGLRAAFLNAYPPGFFEGLNSGKRLPSANQLAMQSAGVRLRGAKALYGGRALSGDLTGEGWRTVLGYPDAPIITPYQAGQRMAQLASEYSFAFYDHWLTDYIGHRGTLSDAIKQLDALDQALKGVLDAWDDDAGLVVLTSDHGNLEDLTARGHTTNPVPALIVGRERHAFAEGLADLTHFAPRIRDMLTSNGPQAAY